MKHERSVFVPVGTFPGRKPVPLNSVSTFNVQEACATEFRAATAVSLETVELLEGVYHISKNNVRTEFETNAVVEKYGNNQSFK